MSVAKKKRTKSSKGQRAAHFALNKVKLYPCPQCKKLILPHRACPFCGYYKGREAVKIKAKKGKNVEEKKK